MSRAWRGWQPDVWAPQLIEDESKEDGRQEDMERWNQTYVLEANGGPAASTADKVGDCLPESITSSQEERACLWSNQAGSCTSSLPRLNSVKYFAQSMPEVGLDSPG